jgi:hypothetical protein
VLGHFSATGCAAPWTALLLLYSQPWRQTMSLWIHLRVPVQQPPQQPDMDFRLALLLHILPYQLRHVFRKSLVRSGKRVGTAAILFLACRPLRAKYIGSLLFRPRVQFENIRFTLYP